jgi:alkylation response protein AidB-like acyl-CoA dehydrogenase
MMRPLLPKFAPSGGRDSPRRRARDQVALDAIQTLGGNGYTSDYPLGRLLRDAKVYEISARTSEIRRMLIALELFEKSA